MDFYRWIELGRLDARLGKRNHGQHAFTLVEIVIVVFIVGTIISFLIPAMESARKDALTMKAEATVSQLNLAAQRLRIKGEPGVGTYGNDSMAALNFYLDNGYIQKERGVDLFGVNFVNGTWELALPW